MVERGERRVDQRRADAARPQLRAQARRTVAAGRARGRPVVGERGVVEIASRGEIGDDFGGHGRRRAAPA